MTIYVGLFRGVNVGGKNRLPMKDLKELLEEVGCRNVESYIQSGNVVFQSPAKSHSSLSKKIGAAVNERHGFEPWVLLLTGDELQRAANANPFPEAEEEPTSLHLNFLASVPPRPNLAAIDKLRADDERYVLRGDVFYLHAPAGIGRSKLAANVERHLGVAMTGRNWRTVSELRTMVRSLGAPTLK